MTITKLKLIYACSICFSLTHNWAQASTTFQCEDVYRGSFNDQLIESSYLAADKYERDWFEIAQGTYGIIKDVKSVTFEFISQIDNLQAFIDNPAKNLEVIEVIVQIKERYNAKIISNEKLIKAIDAYVSKTLVSEYSHAKDIKKTVDDAALAKSRLIKESEDLNKLKLSLDDIADKVEIKNYESLKYKVSKFISENNKIIKASFAFIDSGFLLYDAATLTKILMSSNPDTPALIDATADVGEGAVSLYLAAKSINPLAVVPKNANVYILIASLSNKYILKPFVWGANNDFIDQGNDAVLHAYEIRDMVRCQIEVIGKHEPDIREKIQGLALLKTEKNQVFENFRRDVTKEYNSKISITRLVSEKHSPIYIVYQNILSAIAVAQADADIWIDKASASYNTRKQLKESHISQLQTMINEQKELDQRIQLQLSKYSGQSAYRLEVDDVRVIQWDQSDFSGYFSAGQKITFCAETLIGAQHGATLLFREKNTNTAVRLQSRSIDAATGCQAFEFNQTGRFSPESFWFYNTETASWTRTSILDRHNIQLTGKSRVDQSTAGEDGSGAINDTGVAFCGPGYSRSQAECTATMPQGQDAQYGRDAAAEADVLVKTGYGNQGFDYHKIANDGSVLEREVAMGATAKDWACTKDNVTGLVWEVKTPAPSHYRHNKHRYVWHFANINLQPKVEGTTVACGNTLDGKACNTENYLQKINAEKLCGFSDWRLPSVRELQTVVHYGHSAPAIDPEFFPNSLGYYTNQIAIWSRDKSPVHGFYYVDLYQGTLYQEYHGTDLLLRAVRGESK